MRSSKKMGVLSDKYIKENYADCFLPVPVNKLHAVTKKVSESYVNTSNKRVKEYISTAPLIPQFVSENKSKQPGVLGMNEKNAIKSDLIRKVAGASSSFSILQPPRKRSGVLQEDIGFTQISSMANAEDPNFGEIEKDFVKDSLLDETPMGAVGVKPNLNTILGQNSTKAKEDMVPSGKGAKPELAQILDPSIESKMYLVSELQRQPESFLFVKPTKPGQGKKVQVDQTNMLPENMIRDQAQTTGPPTPTQPLPVATKIPVQPTQQTLSGKNVSKVNDQPIVYKDRTKAISLKGTSDVPNVGDPDASGVDVLRNFLLKNLEITGDPGGLDKYLSSMKRIGLKRLVQSYFPRTAGAPPSPFGAMKTGRGRGRGRGY